MPVNTVNTVNTVDTMDTVDTVDTVNAVEHYKCYRTLNTYCKFFFYAAMDNSILASLGKGHIAAVPSHIHKFDGSGHVYGLLQSHCRGLSGRYHYPMHMQVPLKTHCYVCHQDRESLDSTHF